MEMPLDRKIWVTLVLIAIGIVVFFGVLIFKDIGNISLISSIKTKGLQEECENKGQGQVQCWEDLLSETLEKQGISAAFDVIDHMYEAQSDCHGYVHIIGEEAYKLFSENKDMELTSKTYYCGYGFYHGFMETLLHTSGNIQKAREFCAYVDKQLTEQVKGAEAACYHGIGHGAVDGGDPRYWGDIEGMIKPSIEMCELVAETEFQLYICATGVFNAIDILSLDPKYKLDSIEEDPYWLCDRQSAHYKEACYTNMIPPLLRTMQRDFSKIAQRIETIEEHEEDYSLTSMMEGIGENNYSMRYIVMSALFHEYARANLTKAKEGIMLCHTLKDPRSRIPCIEGLSGAFMKYGEPKIEYIKGLEFCNLPELAKDEQIACFQHIITRLRLWYSSDVASQICKTVKEEFQNFCPDY